MQGNKNRKDRVMKKGISFESARKPFPFVIGIIGIVLAVALQILRLNLVAVVNVAFVYLFAG